MSESAQIFILVAGVVGFTVLILVIRWVIHAGVNKGVNAIDNAVSKRHEEKYGLEKRKLSDIYGDNNDQ
jgi:hypothetical protein